MCCVANQEQAMLASSLPGLSQRNPSTHQNHAGSKPPGTTKPGSQEVKSVRPGPRQLRFVRNMKII